MTDKVTLKSIFAHRSSDSDEWDIKWILNLKLPEDRVVDLAQATDLATQFARAAEWCGERIAILVTLKEEAKDEYKKAWSEAFIYRSGDKSTQQIKKAKADCDPEYLEEKAKYNQVVGHLEWMSQKQSGFMNGYYAMNAIMKNATKEFPLSGWDTTENSYKKNADTSPSEEGDEPEESQEIEELDIENL